MKEAFVIQEDRKAPLDAPLLFGPFDHCDAARRWIADKCSNESRRECQFRVVSLIAPCFRD